MFSVGYKNAKLQLQPTGRYCRWWGIYIRPPGTAAWLFDKDKY